jgi:hypothetical protein
MRRGLCLTTAGLMLLIVPQPAVSQIARGGEVGVRSECRETGAGAERPGPGGAVAGLYRLLRPLSLCATATLLEQYAFSSEVPDDIACERLKPDTVLVWSGKREPTFVEGLLSVARVEARRKVGYALVASLVRTCAHHHRRCSRLFANESKPHRNRF